MKTDQRFAVAADEADGVLRLRFSAVSACEIGEDETALCDIGFEELCAMSRASAAFRSAFAEGSAEDSAIDRDRSVIANGWQSWSFGGELGLDERLRTPVFGLFREFSQRPGRLAARGELLSHFYLGLRAGAERVFLVSRNSGSAPLAFRLRKRELSIGVEAFARGSRLEAGEELAEIRVFSREGYFEAKDAFARIFGGFRLFDRLSFLGSEGSLVPGGYESWYNHYTHISAPLIERDLEAIGGCDNLISEYYIKRGKPTVFQIDDGWERTVGEWEPDPSPEKFPEGMKPLSAKIEAKGYIPGLWLAPVIVNKSSAVYREKREWLLKDEGGRLVRAGYNPGWEGPFYALDLSLPEVGEYLERLFERVVEEWGYRYLKLDFLYAAFLPGVRAKGGAAWEHYERVFGRITSRIKDKAGRPVAWLGCGAPLESSFRHFPLMRIGCDTREAWEFPILRLIGHEGRPAAFANMLDTIGRSILDGTVFVGDPDVVFMRVSNMRLSEGEKELVALVAFLFASQIMFSDDAGEFGDPAERALTERMVALYDRLSGREYGAERVGRFVFSVFSRDGKLRGIANLSERVFEAPEGKYSGGAALVEHAERSGGLVRFAPHTISLYEE
jgi:alpha-galactosidase